MSDPLPSPARPTSPRDLFIGFSILALQGFGGVLPIAQQMLCERKRWLSREEFLEMLAIAQVLPGPNICNLSLMIGDRFFGWRGALAALAGMMAIPMVLVLTVAAFYAQYAVHPMVAGALRGMGAVAAGMIAGTGLRLSSALRRSPLGLSWCVLLAVVAFAAIALLRWPLAIVLLLLGTAGCLRAGYRLSAAEEREA